MNDRREDVSDLIYLSDPNTYELLYVNQSARTYFGIGADLNGLLCYKVLQHRDSPCPFCTNAFLKEGESYAWEHTNEVTGHHYLLNDQLVEWNGKLARLEVAFDVTESKEENARFRNLSRCQQTVLACTRDLYREHDENRAADRMLEQLGSALKADRAYLYALRDGRLWNTHEWCAPDVDSSMELLQGVDIAPFSRWIDEFEAGRCVVIENLAALEGVIDDDEYEILYMQGIGSAVAVPLEQDGRLVGCLGLDNPPAELIRDVAAPLGTLCYFYQTTVQRIEDERRLVTLSYRDALTGLCNRNRYLRDMDQLAESPDEPLGMAFLDINGMKEINDRGGHALGDRVLRECADAMRNAVGNRAQLYRIGGDEFVALAPRIDEASFDLLVGALEHAFESNSLLRVAIGASWSARCDNVAALQREADENMYRAKRRFHRKRMNEPVSPRENGTVMLGERADGGRNVLELARACGTFMDALQVGMAKQAVDDLTVLWANIRYFEIARTLDERNGCRRKIAHVVRAAYEAGETGCSELVHARRPDGSDAWIRIIGTFSEETADSRPVVYLLYVDITDMPRRPCDEPPHLASA